jgi:hypothetical protein
MLRVPSRAARCSGARKVPSLYKRSEIQEPGRGCIEYRLDKRLRLHVNQMRNDFALRGRAQSEAAPSPQEP